MDDFCDSVVGRRMGHSVLSRPNFEMSKHLNSPEDASFAHPKTLLLVDGQDNCRIMTKWILSNFGYTVDSVRNAEEALLLFDPQIHDIVVTDNSMPGIKAVEMAQIIKLRSPSTPVVMYSGQPPENVAWVDVQLKKPTHLFLLKETLDKLLAGRTAVLPPTTLPSPPTKSLKIA